MSFRYTSGGVRKTPRRQLNDAATLVLSFTLWVLPRLLLVAGMFWCAWQDRIAPTIAFGVCVLWVAVLDRQRHA